MDFSWLALPPAMRAHRPLPSIWKKVVVGGVGRELNVTEPGAIERFIEEVSEAFGTPMALVNNAGITRDNLLMRMKDDEWDDIIRTNLTSGVSAQQGLHAGMMKARQGRIVNITLRRGGDR
jgi:3-oxoacyl-[acyl-carrier protein] reductase